MKTSSFIGKIEDEAPLCIKNSIGHNKLIFNLLTEEDYYDAESLLEYKVNINGNKKRKTWCFSGANFLVKTMKL